MEVPIGSMVVPFCGSCLGSYKVIPKRNHKGANGQCLLGVYLLFVGLGFRVQGLGFRFRVQSLGLLRVGVQGVGR